MIDLLVVRPQLAARIAAGESRTEAFGDRHFGALTRGVALELVLPPVPNASQLLAMEVLLGLCLRMDPVIAEVRMSKTAATLDALRGLEDRIPFEVHSRPDMALPALAFGIGPGRGPYVDASDWLIGFDSPVWGTTGISPAGPFFAALEAAKFICLRAVELARGAKLEQQVWPGSVVFDTWTWNYAQRSVVQQEQQGSWPASANIALVGVGGVGAAYLWFISKCPLEGSLTAIDDDIVEWHSMNRSPIATIDDANSKRAKVHAAAAFMPKRWAVRAITRKAEHEEAIVALQQCAAAGGLIASAVGEPETRKFLSRRGFPRIFDAATNSDGSVQLLSLAPGISSCMGCHVRPRAAGAPVGGCGLAQTPQFSGVLPHLAAYAGALLGLEHFRTLLGAEALAGVNTQSIMLPLDADTRLKTRPCQSCEWQCQR